MNYSFVCKEPPYITKKTLQLPLHFEGYSSFPQYFQYFTTKFLQNIFFLEYSIFFLIIIIYIPRKMRGWKECSKNLYLVM